MLVRRADSAAHGGSWGAGAWTASGDIQVVQSAVKMRLEMSSRSQSMPGSRFSPVTALQPWMDQWWLRMASSSRACGQELMVGGGQSPVPGLPSPGPEGTLRLPQGLVQGSPRLCSLLRGFATPLGT